MSRFSSTPRPVPPTPNQYAKSQAMTIFIRSYLVMGPPFENVIALIYAFTYSLFILLLFDLNCIGSLKLKFIYLGKLN